MADNHLILGMDDISVPMDGYVMPCEEHVDAADRVRARLGSRQRRMVVHCYAGISRSTAGAYRGGLRAQSRAATRWRSRASCAALSPTATPNIRIVSLADRVLGRDGRMVEAIDSIGRGEMAYEGVPFRLDLE